MKIENIKFKAKRLDNGEWVKGSFVVMKNPVLDKTTIGIVDEGSATLYEVDPSTICQFTGAKDANGTDLYENDIIHFKGYKPIGIIKWVDDVYAFMVEYDGNLDYLSNVLDVAKVERLGSTQDKEDNSYED